MNSILFICTTFNIILSHDREDELRKELTVLRLELKNIKTSNKKEDNSAKMELISFKKELADVRAKQQFAVNEVKVLMAKLAGKKDGDCGGGDDGKSQEQIDFIDENLKRLKSKKRKKGKNGRMNGSPQFVSRGNTVRRKR
mgnify:CR=1 FL=1